MAVLDNAAILREAYEAWNRRDMDRVYSYALSDARATNVPFETKLSFREYVDGWARGFPDAKVEPGNLIAQGDYVVSESTLRGTHTGSLAGPGREIAPTGRGVEIPFVEIVRFRGGKVAEVRLYFDAATLLMQLGLATGIAATQAPREAPSPAPH